MSAFTVQLKSEPGELASLCEAMAAHNVNLVLCATTHSDSGTVGFVVDDEAAARTALEDAGIEATERPALTVRLENLPGEGAVTFRRLANAGITIDLLLPVRVSTAEFLAVICVDDVAGAKAALGDQVVG
ncbi:MAG TPA: hypothetical protein VEL73_05720 [Mycobacteriales bacterium]|nr:hypothetical protein [Mycobacteriales bacterium]